MSDSASCIRFCEGCPMANGVVETTDDFYTNALVQQDPTQPFGLTFVDYDNRQTSRIEVQSAGVPSYAPFVHNAFATVRNSVEGCEAPSIAKRKFIGRLIALMFDDEPTKSCGAFPGQNPNSPHITLADIVEGRVLTSQSVSQNASIQLSPEY